MKKKIKLLHALKFFFGTIGASTVVMDHAIIGLTIMAIGAACDAAIMYLTPSKE